MAPTETLAEQHFATLETPARRPSRVPSRLLTGSTPRRAPARAARHARHRRARAGRRHARADRGRPSSSRRSRVAVVDEQHRFGVAPARARSTPRARRAAAARPPHDRDADPAHALADRLRRPRHDGAARAARRAASRSRPGSSARSERAGAYEFIREQLRAGRQAYVVCPLVERVREALQAKAADGGGRAAAPRASCATSAVGLLHGQMPPAREGARRWTRFASGEADVLVATTRDRGRDRRPQRDGDAGRGRRALRHLPAPPAARPGRPRRARVATASSSPTRSRERGAGAGSRRSPRERDGFELAEIDLALRGEGELLGTRQPGLPRFRVAALPEDTPLLLEARARGARAAASATARSTRPSSARCWTRRGAASAPSGPSRSPRSSRCGSIARRAGRPAARARRSGGRVRPTSDRVREALFSILGDVDGRRACSTSSRHRRARRSRRSRAAPRDASLVDRDTAAGARATSSDLGLGDRGEAGPRPTSRRASCGRPRAGDALRPRLLSTRPIDSPTALGRNSTPLLAPRSPRAGA